jgi:dihydroceramidase
MTTIYLTFLTKSIMAESNIEAGYWGPIDTTITFCERNYSLSPYFAEYLNAISSSVYIITGAYMILKLGDDAWLRLAGLWLIGIGIGSFAFHMTMRFSLQLFDEIPMVLFALTIIIAKTKSKHHEGIQRFSKLIDVSISVWAITIIIVYIYFKEYQYFLHGFTAMVTVDAILTHMLRSKGSNVAMKKMAQLLSVSSILIGRTFWEIENRLCYQYQENVWLFHTLWHFFSAASAYNSCIFLYLCLKSDDDPIPKLLGYHRSEERKKD